MTKILPAMKRTNVRVFVFTLDKTKARPVAVRKTEFKSEGMTFWEIVGGGSFSNCGTSIALVDGVVVVG